MKNKKIYITSFVILLLMILLMNSAYVGVSILFLVLERGMRELISLFLLELAYHRWRLALSSTVVGVVDMDILYLFRMPMVYAGIWGIILNYFIQLVHTLYKGR